MARENSLSGQAFTAPSSHETRTNGLTDQATVPLIINNQEYFTADTFPVHAPATLTAIGQCSSASSKDVDLALEASSRAQQAWRQLIPSKKREVFRRAADIMHSRADELITYTMLETGADHAYATMELYGAIETFREVAGCVGDIHGWVPQTNDAGTSALVLKEPYGVILAISPWNAPFHLGVRAVAYPLAAGNAVILKGNELCPRIFWAITTILHAAGLSDGVLNLLFHSKSTAAEVTKQLIESPIIKKINFTGSTVVGRIIAEAAGRQLKPVLLELGGKASAIVLQDADLKLAAIECAKGAFIHSGQVCMSTEKILVHESISSAFEEELKTAVAMVASVPTDGSGHVLINSAAVEKNRSLRKDAIERGATVVVGDVEHKEKLETVLKPAVIKGVTADMDLYHVESFGPTVSLISFADEAEAILLANDTEYGLTSAVFTENLATAFRIAGQIESGAVHINGMTVYDDAALPHGGTKASGYGRFGIAAIEEWVRTKNVTYRLVQKP